MVCRSAANSSINEVATDDQKDDDSILIETVDCNQRSSAHVKVDVCIAGNGTKSLLLKVDTGAKVNVMSEETAMRFANPQNIDKSQSILLVGFSGNVTRSLGSLDLVLVKGCEQYTVCFQIAKSCDNTLLGFKDCVRLGYVVLSDVYEITDTKVNPSLPSAIIEQYSSLFDDKVGTLPVKYKITLNAEVEPVIRPVQSVPIALKPKLKDALDRMVECKIIAPVTKPTEWVSVLVVTTKKNTDDLRICIDPGDLNRAIKRPHHPLNTIEQIATEIPGAKYFTVVDAREAFYHIPLEDKSSYLTTFGTPFGRYRYLRMPMGICSASEVYQRAIEQLLEGYPCHVIMDDILISGKTESEHDANLHSVLRRLQKINLKL